MSLYSNVLLLLKEESIQQELFTRLNNFDNIGIGMTSRVKEKEIFSYQAIITSFDFLKVLRVWPELKSRLIVLDPPQDKFQDMVKADYKRFIFDIEDDRQLFKALYRGDALPEIFVEAGPFQINFKDGVVLLDGRSLYFTKGEMLYLKKRYIDKEAYTTSTGRVHLMNIRKRHGGII